MEATELLDLAAAYVRAQDAADIAAPHGVTADPTPSDVAARFADGLDQYVTEAVRRALKTV
jgi:hypothetical protein